MNIPQSKRGRPKGTGLDDRAHLVAIASLISQSKELKPTTAIKSLGISNPSTIRRLRDKFNLERDELLAHIDEQKTQIKETRSLGDTPSDEECSTLSAAQKAAQGTAASTPAISSGTCALNHKQDPKIIEPENTEKQKKQKKKKHKNNAKKAAKTELKKTKLAQKKRTSDNTAQAKQDACDKAPENAMNLMSAWFALGAQILNTTARAQLELLEIIEKTPWYLQAHALQIQAQDAWLCSLTPQIAIRDPLNQTSKENQAFK